MGRPVILSNNSMVVGLNERGMVHDFYYPYVGEDNLTTARSAHHMIGIWVDNTFSWLDSNDWQITVDFEETALISQVSALNKKIGVELKLVDFVDCTYNVFCRKVDVTNLSDKQREIRLFFHQVFQFSIEGRADTALYVPRGNYIYDYKGHCSLLVYLQDENSQGFDQFAVGNYAIEDKQGTFVDAEDGELSGNLVEHGSVDSVIRSSLFLAPNSSATLRYWVVADDSQTQAEKVHALFKTSFDERLDKTRNHWQNWLQTAKPFAETLDPKYKPIFNKSLLLVKAHIDKRGGIIASCDSSIYNYGRDYYTYVWPRDGALSLLPLIELGYTDEPKKFFAFCADTIHPGGYMMHKYQPDRSIGSTWHPLLHENHPELAIQEDETASVIIAIGRYLKKSGDKEFVEMLYKSLIKPASDFMAGFIDDETNLPHPSYDLWEETFGTHAYTVTLTHSALIEAINIASSFGHEKDAENWQESADRIKSGFKLLVHPETGVVRRNIKLTRDGDLSYDERADSATTYSLLEFGNSLVEEQTLKVSFEHHIKHLYNKNPAGGVGRYEHDNYFLSNKKYLGNAWFICTLWLAQYLVHQNRRDLADKLLSWTLDHATYSGVLSEQIDAESGAQVSVAPLVWSHAELVYTLIAYYSD